MNAAVEGARPKPRSGDTAPGAGGTPPSTRHKWRRAITAARSVVAVKGGKGRRDDAAEELRVQTASKRAEAKAAFLESGGTPEVRTRERFVVDVAVCTDRGTPRGPLPPLRAHCTCISQYTAPASMLLCSDPTCATSTCMVSLSRGRPTALLTERSQLARAVCAPQ